MNAKVIILRRDSAGIIMVDEEPSYPVPSQVRLAKALNLDSALERAEKSAVIFVEGESDKRILETAHDKLFPGIPSRFDIISVYSKSQLRTILSDERTVRTNTGKYFFGIFDFDSAYNDWNGCFRSSSTIDEHNITKGLIKKHSRYNMWAVLLPVPASRATFASTSLRERSVLSIEFLFNDDCHLPGMIDYIDSPASTAKIPTVVESKKIAFSFHVATLSSEKFENFRTLFDNINSRIP